MAELSIKLTGKFDNSYKIIIGRNILTECVHYISQSNYSGIFIITDSNLKTNHGKSLLTKLKKQGIPSDLISFKAGEKQKTLQTVNKLCDQLLSKGADRKSLIIALGGGVTGDIAGFVSASYMRGVDFVQVPTSLLAMVDSSIGGKVGVDLEGGKNSVGSFYQPQRVFIDLDFLGTLPKKEFVNGMAEIVKHALICDKKLFNYIERNIEQIKKGNKKILEHLVIASCRIKSKVVMDDSHESGLRKILNYGHTIGHAIESLTGYSKLSHGQAVGMGMVIEGKLAVIKGMLSSNSFNRQNDVLSSLGLAQRKPKLIISSILREIKKDKKAVSGRANFSLVDSIGHCTFDINATDKEIKSAWEESL